MAAAEARTAWQRTANRYFVQEDAKRAPKLACCQSSTSSSKQADAGPLNAADTPDHRAVGRMPFNNSPSYSSLPPDAKWWLQMQPNDGHQRGLNFQQLNAKTAGVETSSFVAMDKDLQARDIAAMSEESFQDIDYKDLDSFLDVKKHSELTKEELNVLDSSKVDQDYLDVKSMTDYYEFLEMEMVGSSVSKKTSEFSSNTDSSWVRGEKVPWWRVTDGEELASFVAHRSLHHVENCDLPPPQTKHVRREAQKPAKSIDHDEIYMSSLEWETHGDAISSPSYSGLQRKHWSSAQGVLSQNESTASEPKSDMPEKGRISDNDPYKAKLLEALCHSQTRAREAEKAAKQAYSDKEHILKLFFRQASQLFAYKQWFKLLQLENLLLQTEDGSSPSPSPSTVTESPHLLPWMPQKKLHKSWPKLDKAKRRRRGSQESEIGKYAVAFAVGFTLVGAGLILGWTVGWLLPAI